MRKIFVAWVVLLGASFTFAQTGPSADRKTQNLVVVTLDGFRWQEVYRGAEQDLLDNKKFTPKPEGIKKRFWADTPRPRREKLLPFIWGTLAKNGRLYGNRDLGNLVNVKNPYWFSYPGYNEIFTGFPDKRVNSNKYPDNPNENVLEFLNHRPDFKNRVGAFTTWGAFTRILNAQRSGLPVTAGYALVESNPGNEPLSEAQMAVNAIQTNRLPGQGPRDALTFAKAMTWMHRNHPRVLYIAFGLTDHYAHAGKYDEYLTAAHKIDGMLAQLWETLQSDPQYKGATTLFITVDHGRGLGGQWTSHGRRIAHSNEIWFAVMGPDTSPMGEVRQHQQWYQNQFAQALAQFVGLRFTADHPIGEAIPLMDVSRE